MCEEPCIKTQKCKMRNANVRANSEPASDTDSSDQKPNTGNQPNRPASSSGGLSNDEAAFDGKPDEDKAGDSYAISWNNIFYEIDDANRKTKLISRLFKRNKFKENDEFIKPQEKSGRSQANSQFSQFPSNFAQASIHIIERHRQRTEIISGQRSINLSQTTENETIKRVTDHGGACKRVILNNISGSLRCGQLLGLIGPSGVGR